MAKPSQREDYEHNFGTYHTFHALFGIVVQKIGADWRWLARQLYSIDEADAAVLHITRDYPKSSEGGMATELLSRWYKTHPGSIDSKIGDLVTALENLPRHDIIEDARLDCKTVQNIKKYQMELSSDVNARHQRALKTVLFEVSNLCGEEWRILFRTLYKETRVECDIAVIGQMYSKYGNRELVYQMLITWRRLRGASATYAQLIDGLTRHGREEVADRVRAICRKFHVDETHALHDVNTFESPEGALESRAECSITIPDDPNSCAVDTDQRQQAQTPQFTHGIEGLGEESNKLDRYVREKGVTQLSEYVYSRLNDWKEQSINVAVIGRPGTGKSSFVNAICGLRSGDEGAARVGFFEPTLTIKSYAHPQNANVLFWDLPGVGPFHIPKEGYLEFVNFDKYDFFLIFSRDRLSSDDIWLMKEVINIGKSCFLIRTKFNNDIKNHTRSYPTSFHSSEYLIKELRRSYIDYLLLDNISDPKVFIISNKHPTMFDFPSLKMELFRCLPSAKLDAWRMALHSFSVDAVKQKSNILKNMFH